MGRVAMVLVALASLVACSSTNPSPPPSTGPQHEMIGGIDVIVRGGLVVAGSRAQVKIMNNFFIPNKVTAPAGSTVTFELKNEGTLHNFSITEQTIDHDVQPGTTANVDVKVPASGRVVFFCKYHRAESGMVGAIDAS